MVIPDATVGQNQRGVAYTFVALGWKKFVNFTDLNDGRNYFGLAAMNLIEFGAEFVQVAGCR